MNNLGPIAANQIGDARRGAVPDSFTRGTSRQTSGRTGPAGGLAALAEKLVATSLDDVRRIREYEQQFIFRVEREPAVDLQARRSVWRMFAASADEAEQVLARVAGV